MEVDAIVKKFQKELNSGTASLAVLGLMERRGEPLYGYQIAKLLERRAGWLPMKPGALYPVLRSLEAAGLLRSEVRPSTSAPPRRYYSVTDAGRQMLERWIDVWQATRDFIERVLAGPAAAPARDQEEEDD
ncbi:MAG: PadR family transcriptional regulator [Thermoanaerobaculia bacterium]|nr:PadR family transcriptional regulator [Thermoanaerobaculia bacterium]